MFENAGVPGAAVNDSEEPQEYEQVGFNTQQKKVASIIYYIGQHRALLHGEGTARSYHET